MNCQIGDKLQYAGNGTFAYIVRIDVLFHALYVDTTANSKYIYAQLGGYPGWKKL